MVAAGRRRRCDPGAAVIEFVGVLALLLLLFLVVFQLGVVLHLRTVMTAAAAEGARYAANADRTEVEGAVRAREVIASGLSDRLARSMTVTVGPDPANPGVIEVTISGPAPLFVAHLPAFRITVRGHALEEGR